MSEVAIVMGSKSDKSVSEKTENELDKLEIQYDTYVISAHKQPDKLDEFVNNADDKGYKVIIAIAGLAAHLPGVIASKTVLPVIGVPVPAGPFKGVDALLSCSQMPSGVPVATMGAGKWGAKIAGVLAAQILALSDEQALSHLQEYRKNLS